MLVPQEGSDYVVTVAVRVSAAAFVASTGWSGAEVGGTVVGIVTAGTATGALWVAMRGANRSRRREYEQELEDAHDDGVRDAEQRLNPEITRLIDDRNNWRTQAQYWINRGQGK